METLLAILLYLGAIFSHSAYHVSEIDQISADREPEIVSVENNDSRMQVVNEEYRPLVKTVIIYDYEED